jgi:hypothetical protein
MWAAWERGDRRGAVSAIPERLVDDLIVRGAPEAVRGRVRRYLDAGVDTVFLQLQSSEPDPERRREIQRQTLRALAPARA